MRRIMAVLLALIAVLSMGSCGSGDDTTKEATTESAVATESASRGAAIPEMTATSAVEETGFSITVPSHTGLFEMVDSVKWEDSAFCAVSYLGTRETYLDAMSALYDKKFTSVDEAAYNTMEQVDLGGNSVVLVVPRFELESINVFKVAYDEEGVPHIRSQAANVHEPFLLFCDISETATNAQIDVELSDDVKPQKYNPIWEPGEQSIRHTITFQDIK